MLAIKYFYVEMVVIDYSYLTLTIKCMFFCLNSLNCYCVKLTVGISTENSLNVSHQHTAHMCYNNHLTNISNTIVSDQASIIKQIFFFFFFLFSNT